MAGERYHANIPTEQFGFVLTRWTGMHVAAPCLDVWHRATAEAKASGIITCRFRRVAGAPISLLYGFRCRDGGPNMLLQKHSMTGLAHRLQNAIPLSVSCGGRICGIDRHISEGDNRCLVSGCEHQPPYDRPWVDQCHSGYGFTIRLFNAPAAILSQMDCSRRTSPSAHTRPWT